jgi:hypothetical protein
VAFNWHGSDSRTVQPYGFVDRVSARGLSTSLNWEHHYGEQIFNNVAITFNRNTTLTNPDFADGPNVAAELGIKGAADTHMDYGPPALNFTNFGALTGAAPFQAAIYGFGASDQLALSLGRHNWTLGGTYSRLFNNTRTDPNGRGTFAFTGLATSSLDINGQPVLGTGYDFVDFLLGLPQSASISFGNSSTYFRSTRSTAFLQDDYRVLPNLTLNLGWRYEYFSPWDEKYGRISNLLMASAFSGVRLVTQATPGMPPGLIEPDRTNFAPRTALAWRPWAKSSIMVRAGYTWFYDPSVYDQFTTRLAAQPPFATSGSVNTSAGNVLTLATGLVALSSSRSITNTFAVNENYRDMYAQSWSVSVQLDLPWAILGELAYMGTKGTHLDVQGMPNQAPPGPPLTAEERLPIVNATGFIFDTPDGNSIYHAAQARLTRRFSHGFSANAVYSYAKSIDDSMVLAGAGNVIAQNFFDLRAERGLSGFNRCHFLTADYVWTSPFSQPRALSPGRGLMAKLVLDWTLSGNMILATGTPMTARVLGSQTDPAGTGTIGASRASATGASVHSGGPGLFNLNAFTLPSPGQYGNAGRNTIPGPGLVSLNLSLTRTIRIGQHKQLQIRIESTNVTNHVNIVSVGTVVNALTYGMPMAAGMMRTVTPHLAFTF